MRQAEHSASRSAASASGVRELRVMIFRAASFGTPADHSLIGGTIRPSPKTRGARVGRGHHRAPLKAAGRGAGEGAGARAADVVVVAERLYEGHHPRLIR